MVNVIYTDVNPLGQNRQQLSRQMDEIEKEYTTIKQGVDRQEILQNLLKQIRQWENDSTMQIQLAAKKVEVEIQQLSVDQSIKKTVQ
jgi:hypothetical protein